MVTKSHAKTRDMIWKREAYVGHVPFASVMARAADKLMTATQNTVPSTPDVLVQRFVQFFGRPPEAIARAPGRVEFIGNHTDYNGGSVLGAAIDRYV
jgi:hypothetical protein